MMAFQLTNIHPLAFPFFSVIAPSPNILTMQSEEKFWGLAFLFSAFNGLVNFFPGIFKILIKKR